MKVEDIALPQGGPSYEDLKAQVMVLQGMIPELQDHVGKLSGRAAELSGMLRQKDVQLAELRAELIRQGELLAAKSTNGKGDALPAVNGKKAPLVNKTPPATND